MESPETSSRSISLCAFTCEALGRVRMVATAQTARDSRRSAARARRCALPWKVRRGVHRLCTFEKTQKLCGPRGGCLYRVCEPPAHSSVACTYRGEAEQVGEVLRRYSVHEVARGRQPELIHLQISRRRHAGRNLARAHSSG
eukprot:5872319-Pleurochrysis_carterae.AAC.3